jgi:hypothetical protein
VQESPFGELDDQSRSKQRGRLPLSGLGILSICIGLVEPGFVSLGCGLVVLGYPSEAAHGPGLGHLVMMFGSCYGFILCPVGALIGVCALLQTNRRRWPVLQSLLPWS